MTYPDGLPTKNVTFGRAVTFESGTQLGMRVTVKASRNLVHRPTGQPLVSVSTVFSSTGEADGILTLPICDSPDMGLGNGTNIAITADEVTHTYTAQIDYLAPASSSVLTGLGRVVGPFVVLSTSPDTVDLDDLLATPDSPTEGIAIAVPDTWTQLVQEAQDAAAEAAASASRFVVNPESTAGLPDGTLIFRT